MASTSSNDGEDVPEKLLDDLKRLLWGSEIKHEVFRRWTQGFSFSQDEPTALIQHEGGPCAVIAPVQAFLLKNLLFAEVPVAKEKWRNLQEEQAESLLCGALEDIFRSAQSSDVFYLLHCASKSDRDEDDLGASSQQQQQQSPQEDEGSSQQDIGSPKKRCFSHEPFHQSLRCKKCNSRELRNHLKTHLSAFRGQYGVLLVLYSLILTKGIDHLKNEVEDPSEPLIDGTYGHGSQSLINLLITGKATSNVWDNDKEVSGLRLHGITKQSTIGFLTLVEHYQFCEVGWYLKNPEYPIWLLGSETHITVLFSEEKKLVSHETPEAAARRIFGTFDTEGSGFIVGDLLGDLMGALDLVSEPEYVKIMKEKMDPEQLGIITLNTFMEEFYPSEPQSDVVNSFTYFHYNGLQRSCPENKVRYQEGSAAIMEMPELQIITDSSQIKHCLMTKWPTIELKWKNEHIPSLN